MRSADMRVGRGVILAMVLVVSAATVSTQTRRQGQDAGPITAFEGARVITGEPRGVIENATFVVSGNRFVQIGRSGAVPIPAGATRINLAGKTVMPAIVDTH